MENQLEQQFAIYQIEYLACYPYVSLKRNETPDGNGILYAGVYGMLVHKLFGSYKNASKHSWDLYREATPSNQESGVITKGKHKIDDPQGHDDYIGLCALSFLGDLTVANLIAAHGRETFWTYRSGRTSFWSSLFFVKPGVVQHIKLCNGESWNMWDRFWFRMALIDSQKKARDNTSGRIMEWLMVNCYVMSKNRSKACDKAVDNWERSIRSLYPNLMGDVFEIYYGKDHLFSKFGKGII